MFDWVLFGELLLQWLTLTFMLVGLLGLLIPIFPGITVIWLAALIYAIAEAMTGQMDFWGWLLFALITILMVVGSFVDNIIMAHKLRETGTPWSSIAVGFIAGLVAGFAAEGVGSAANRRLILIAGFAGLLVVAVGLVAWRTSALHGQFSF